MSSCSEEEGGSGHGHGAAAGGSGEEAAAAAAAAVPVASAACGDSTASHSSSSGCNKSYGLHSVCLIITAMPVESAFCAAQDNTACATGATTSGGGGGGPYEGIFVTRHTADCTFSMVEEAAIPFTGYLPQVYYVQYYNKRKMKVALGTF